ncbi:MobF family relaxase [Tautonia plasticadhaerens]|uniref:Multifunctional conjugation protein TraI n=1 Tax=Tautonia plasticadhaerens TaxID=2527974 RepID=A0A518H292_9BACT|nr:MobF family relaxase [Tautonia plasticadhaerens]QDV34953.1 Multifunctional conjugation protein TraI [Tautonia plasticadhaerens]
MINATFPANAEAAIGYYGHAGTELEKVGEWQGKGAEKLGLSGAVDMADWRALVRGKAPDGTKLAQRLRDDRRVLLDLTLSVNKDTAVLLSLVDPRIEGVIQRANAVAMELAESYLDTRVKGLLGTETVQSAAMISAPFYHQITRAREPGYHIHNTIIALTPYKDRWYAPEFDRLVSNSDRIKRLFHSQVARGMRELGYQTELTKDNFRVVGFPDSIRREFSTGQGNIDHEQAMRETALSEQIRRTSDPVELRKLEGKLGFVKSPKGRAALAVQVREKKQRDLDPATLKADWWGRLTPEEANALQAVLRQASSREPSKLPDHSRQFFGQSVNRLSQQYGRVPEEDLFTDALKTGVGEVTLGGLRQTLEQSELLRVTVNGTPMVQTWENRQKEKELLAFARSGGIVWISGKPDAATVREAEQRAGKNPLWVKDAGSQPFAELHRLSQAAEAEQRRIVLQGLPPRNAPDGHTLRLLQEVAGLKPLDDKPLKPRSSVLKLLPKAWRESMQQHVGRLNRMHFFKSIQQEHAIDEQRTRAAKEQAERREAVWER